MSQEDAVHIQGLAQPGRGMGENGRRLGKEEDPRVRQQQNPLASPTVSRFSLSVSFRFSYSSPSRRNFFVRFAAMRTAHSCYSSIYIDPTDSSVCLHANAERSRADRPTPISRAASTKSQDPSVSMHLDARVSLFGVIVLLSPNSWVIILFMAAGISSASQRYH